MPEQPRSERKTQNRIIDLFTDKARPDWLGTTPKVKWGIAEKIRKRRGHRMGTAWAQDGHGGFLHAKAIRPTTAK